MKRTLRQAQSGFTMLEIMLVVMIMVVLLGLAASKLGPNLDIAKETGAKADIQTIATQLMLYQANGFLPSTEQGLKALVIKPESEPRPRSWHKLLPEVPLDPWKQEYRYQQPGTHNPDGFDLFSGGKDLKPGTADDIGNWKSEQ